MKWLIESDVFDDTESRLVEVLKSQGIEYHILKYVPFDINVAARIKKEFPDDNAIFYGSLNFATKLHDYYKPGVFGTANLFECTSYYPLFNNLLLNQDYVMLPFGELQRKKEFLFTLFGNEDAIFIRPNSCLKEFTGTILYRKEFQKGLEECAFYEEVKPSLLTVVSSPKNILEEYRFVIINNEVCTGSFYGGGGTKNKPLPTDATEVIEYANKAAQRFPLIPVWILDICRTSEGFRVLEIGCFNYAGLYCCDLTKIVSQLDNMYRFMSLPDVK